jgi:hypothetical protein
MDPSGAVSTLSMDQGEVENAPLGFAKTSVPSDPSLTR